MPVTNDPTDPAFQEAIQKWEEQGYRVVEKLKAPDTTWVQEWAAWNKEVMESVKIIFGDKDAWGFMGNLIIYSIGEGNLTGDQKAEVDAIKVILAKPELTFPDLGEILGRLIHLITPELRSVLQNRVPGIMTILDVLARIGGVV